MAAELLGPKTTSAATAAEFTRALLSWDSLLFALICLADMGTTLYWVHAGTATEANPWLATCLAHGVFYFCLSKIMSFVPFLLVAAWYRPAYPKFVPLAMRCGLVAYILVYVCCVGCQLLQRG